MAECKAIARHSCLGLRSSQAVRLIWDEFDTAIKAWAPADENATLFTLPADPMMMVNQHAFAVREAPMNDARSTALGFVRPLNGCPASAA